MQSTNTTRLRRRATVYITCKRESYDDVVLYRGDVPCMHTTSYLGVDAKLMY